MLLNTAWESSGENIETSNSKPATNQCLPPHHAPVVQWSALGLTHSPACWRTSLLLVEGLLCCHGPYVKGSVTRLVDIVWLRHAMISAFFSHSADRLTGTTEVRFESFSADYLGGEHWSERSACEF